jgi:hypothetical protein
MGIRQPDSSDGQYFRERYSTCNWSSSLSVHNAASGDCRNISDPVAHYRRRERFEMEGKGQCSGSVHPRMKAAVYTRYGPPDVVQITDVEKPVPYEDEVLIKVRAASNHQILQGFGHMDA